MADEEYTAPTLDLSIDIGIAICRGGVVIRVEGKSDSTDHIYTSASTAAAFVKKELISALRESRDEEEPE